MANNLIALFRGRFYQTPIRSIYGGNGILFTDASDENFSISLARYGRLSKAVAATGTTALTAAESAHRVLEFTGAITGNVVVTSQGLNPGDQFALFNNTTGAHTLTFQGPSGSGLAVTQGKRVQCYWDGTDIFALGAEA